MDFKEVNERLKPFNGLCKKKKNCKDIVVVKLGYLLPRQFESVFNDELCQITMGEYTKTICKIEYMPDSDIDFTVGKKDLETRVNAEINIFHSLLGRTKTPAIPFFVVDKGMIQNIHHIGTLKSLDIEDNKDTLEALLKRSGYKRQYFHVHTTKNGHTAYIASDSPNQLI